LVNLVYVYLSKISGVSDNVFLGYQVTNMKVKGIL